MDVVIVIIVIIVVMVLNMDMIIEMIIGTIVEMAEDMDVTRNDVKIPLKIMNILSIIQMFLKVECL